MNQTISAHALPGGAPPDMDVRAGIGSSRPVWLGLLAFALGGAGQWLLFAPDTAPMGALLLLVGGLVGALAWSGEPRERLRAATRGTIWRQIKWGRPLAFRLTGVATSLVLAFASIVAYLANPRAIFGLQGSLWLASMGLLAFTCAGWHRPAVAREDAAVELTWTRSEYLWFAGLLALALATHLAFLGQIPWRFHFDEGFAYREMMRFYRGPAIPLFTTTWENTGLPSLWFGIAGTLMHVSGTGLAGVRFAVALAGAVTVVPVYALARLVWGRSVAAFAGLGVAASAAYVHYSRVSILNVTTPLVWSVCFYFLLKGLRSRRPVDFAWSGMAAGLSMYTYYGTRLLPFLLALFALYLAVFHFRAFLERLGLLALVAVGFVAGFGPLLGYFIDNPSMWAGRGFSAFNIPPVIPATWGAVVADWNTLAPLAWRNFLGLSVLPGQDTVYYAPFLLPAEGALVLLGAVFLLWRWRQPAAFLVLLWGLGPVIAGGVLLDWTTTPNFAHWAPAFPALYLMMALPAAMWCKAVLASPRPMLRRIGTVVVALLVALDLVANAHFYLVDYPLLVPPNAEMNAVQGRYIASVGPNVRIRNVGDSAAGASQENASEFAEMMSPPGTRANRFFNPSRELPVVGDPQHDLAFLMYNDELVYLPIVQRYYPGGTIEEIKTPDGQTRATSYRVSAGQGMSRYGVLAIFSRSGQQANEPTSTLWTGQVATAGAIPDDLHATFPLTGTWSGAFRLSVPGDVAWSVTGASGATLTVQGTVVTPGQAVELDEGWVPFTLTAVLRGPARLHLYVQQAGGGLIEPDTAHLWPWPAGHGLLAILGQGAVQHRIDPFIGASLLWPPKDEPEEFDPEALPLALLPPASAQVRWEGFVRTDSGQYTMKVRGAGAITMTIDGTPVITACSEGDRREIASGSVRLASGWHQVRIVRFAGSSGDGVEWFWTPPGSSDEIVPPEALRTTLDTTASGQVVWPDAPVAAGCP